MASDFPQQIVALSGKDASGTYAPVRFPAGQIEHEIDTTANDSDKTFTVPSGEIWVIPSIVAELASSGTAGNRVMRVLVQNSSGQLLYRRDSDTNQVAGVTRYYQFMPLNAGSNSAIDIIVPIPHVLEVPPSGTIRILDKSAVDAAADDMEVTLTHYTYKV
jgi:hypothetical protein